MKNTWYFLATFLAVFLLNTIAWVVIIVSDTPNIPRKSQPFMIRIVAEAADRIPVCDLITGAFNQISHVWPFNRLSNFSLWFSVALFECGILYGLFILLRWIYTTIIARH